MSSQKQGVSPPVAEHVLINKMMVNGKKKIECLVIKIKNIQCPEETKKIRAEIDKIELEVQNSINDFTKK